MKKAVLFISHGSHSPKTKLEVSDSLYLLKQKSPIPIFEFAFLEIESPSIPEGIDLCVRRGAEEIIVLFNFLNSGRHADRDIPKIIDEAHLRYPHVKFRLTKPLSHYPEIIGLFLNILKEYE